MVEGGGESGEAGGAARGAADERSDLQGQGTERLHFGWRGREDCAQTKWEVWWCWSWRSLWLADLISVAWRGGGSERKVARDRLPGLEQVAQGDY